MKKHLFITLFLLLSFAAYSQVVRPIKWKTSISEQEVKQGGTVDLIFTADLEGDWYLYSTDFSKDLGPTVTTFKFTPHASYQLVGEVKPVGARRKHDPVWDGEISYFLKRAEFRQTIKVLKPVIQVKVAVDYQVCSDKQGQCIPFDEDFTFTELKVIQGTPGNAPAETPVVAPATAPAQKDTAQTPAPVATDSTNKAATDSVAPSSNENRVPDASLLAEEEAESLWGFMAFCFLGGLAALFTPCVFPIIPMTVAFFTGRASSRSAGIVKALFYGFSIIAIYTIIGVVVSLVFGADAANILATHWLPNMLFFLVFFVFALSFFGLFEIVLPSGLVNAIDSQADRGGYVGVFFMALTLVVVSFSCTGPIAGSLLFQSAQGNFLKPALGMFAFSSAFAIPFTLFAIFPSWLNSLPKSGGWLNSVKVVLGFVELALAFKFLSMVDQVYHWGILDREIFIAIWAAIAFCLGMYLLGKITLPHDSPVQSISVIRLLLAIVSFVFVLYLVPGMFGAPLKALSGYLPPQTTHDFDLVSLIRQNAASTPASASASKVRGKYANKFNLPHGLSGYFDYREGLAAAKAAHKPVFIDFTGHGCVNCREMEANVWSDPEVLKRLQENYIIIALYVDDPTKLPESEWVTSAYDGKVKKTIGKINADLQITRFKRNSQPYYVLLDENGELLVKPKAYDLNVDNFVKFLDAGVEAFRKRN